MTAHSAHSTKLALPDFHGTHCLCFTACGHVETVNIRRTSEEPSFFVRCKKGSRTLLINAFSRWDRKRLHFHIDVLNLSALKGEKQVPRSEFAGTIEELQSYIERFDGMAVAVGMSGLFNAKRIELSQHGLLQLLEPSVAEASSIRFRSLEVEFEDRSRPVKIAFRADDDWIKAEIVTQTETQIGRSYLADMLAHLHAEFVNAFID